MKEKYEKAHRYLTAIELQVVSTETELEDMRRLTLKLIDLLRKELDNYEKREVAMELIEQRLIEHQKLVSKAFADKRKKDAD